MDDWEVVPRVAVAVALKAQEQGIARLATGADELLRHATAIIRQAREATQLLMDSGAIPAPPAAPG